MNTSNLNTLERYNNRDVNWLGFNGRVLQEATNPENPLYERLKFLAIFSSNLDEFFKVRVSKLRQIGKLKKSVRKPLALKPNKTLKEILEKIQKQQESLGALFYDELIPEMRKEGIELLLTDTFKKKNIEQSRVLFNPDMANQLPVFFSSNATVESFEDGILYLVMSFEDTAEFAFLKVPTATFGRFIALSDTDELKTYAFLEDVLKLHVQQLFPDKAIVEKYVIKISRDAELYLDDDYEGEWVQQIYDSLSQRQEGQPTRLLYEEGMPKPFQKQLRKLLGLGKIDMVLGGKHHNFSDFFAFPRKVATEKLSYEPMPPLPHRDFEAQDDIFKLITEADRLLHFPYQRFDYLERWLEQAAMDERVQTIHISLYRVASDSKLTSALLTALKQKKEVNIFVEAKARFDEGNNLKWGRIFEEHGGNVLYSFPNVKVHSKILLIERIEEKNSRHYAYIGTGNFNAKTAKIYSDHGLFTANQKITGDLKQVFKVLKRELLLPKLSTLFVSPFNTRTGFEQLLKNEIENARLGLPARISIKMNNLEDKTMINWFYEASQAGVQIRLLVRGFCCLIPGIEGLSENIQVVSILDRFLEHARVFLFHNNGSEKLFMGSADWMTRNLDKRIEVLVPIVDPRIFEELKQILEIQFADNQKARIIDKEGSNRFVKTDSDTEIIRSQTTIYEYLQKQRAVEVD